MRKGFWLFTASLFLLTACPQRTAVWIEPGSTAAHLILRIADVRGGSKPVSIGVVRVNPCGESDVGAGATWVVAGINGTEYLSKIVYGETPSGFVAENAAKKLTPGCYRVSVSGTGRTEFTIKPDGPVVEK